jgi:hypothetical protein
MKKLTVEWKDLFLGTLLSGIFTELLNFNIYQIWVYEFPWNLWLIPILNLSPMIIFIWTGLFLVSYFILNLLITILNVKHSGLKTFFKFWIISWIISGFLLESFNSLIYRTWYYPEQPLFSWLKIPFLNFSFFVPTIGWGGCGILTFLGYLLIEKIGNYKKGFENFKI